MESQSGSRSFEVFSASQALNESQPFRENRNAIFSARQCLAFQTVYLILRHNFCLQIDCPEVSCKGHSCLDALAKPCHCQFMVFAWSSLFQSPAEFNLTLKEECPREHIFRRRGRAEQSRRNSFCIASKKCSSAHSDPSELV